MTEPLSALPSKPALCRRKPAARQRRLLLLVSASVAGGACSAPDPADDSRRRAASRAAFENRVKPLLESRCSWCHSNDLAHAGLNLQNRDNTLKGSRPWIVPGAPGKSLVYLAVTRRGSHPQVMPGDGWGITARQERALHDWIAFGAEWPDGPGGHIHRKPYKIVVDDYL